jgi:hypothetical protein
VTPASLGFLIVGTARSGTTLVQRLCCELPGVWVPRETHFWSVADEARFRFSWPLRGEERSAMVEWMLGRLVESIPLQRAPIINEMTTRERRVGLWTVFESVVAALSPPGTVLMGEKTPNHLVWWEHLTDAVPTLKLIAVVRDPRAVLRSHRRVEWGEKDPFGLGERWLHHQRAIGDAGRLLGPDRCLTLRYEDLVADPERHHARLAAFLGLPFEPEPIDPGTLAAYPLFSERESWKGEAMEPVSSKRVSSWRTELTKDDVAAVEAAAGEIMGAFGYETEATGVATVPDPDAQDRVAAYRHWAAQVAGLTSLPIY